MVVTVILGVLTMVAVPLVSDVGNKARVASLKGQLSEIAVLQEAHYARHREYAKSLDDLGWTPEDRVQVEIRLPDTTARGKEAEGWGARATHAESSVTCAIYVGDVEPFAPAQEEGTVTCR